MTENRTGQDDQLVYRIDCDKHYSAGGAPPILVLQKHSSKPPIIILEGMQTYPSKTPIIRDERRDKSQGYIFQDERKPPPNNAQLNLPVLPHLHSSHNGENPYSHHQPMPASIKNQHYNQEHPVNQSHDLSSFGNNSSDLSYNNNTASFSHWMYDEQHRSQQPYSTNNYGEGNSMTYLPENNTGPNNIMYGGRYTQNQPYYWQSFQHDPWTNPQPMTTQNKLNPSSPFLENINFGEYNNTMYERMSMMPMTARQTYYDSPSAYQSSSPWLTYNNSTMRMSTQESTMYPAWNYYEHSAPPLQRNPTDIRQPAFRVVNTPRRSKSVTFAPLPDNVSA